MNSRFPRFKKLLPLLLAGIFLLTAQPVAAAEQYVSDNSVRQDPLQGIKQRGQMSVGEFTGAATYNYPIDLPAGRNGLTPALTITHNSQDNSLYNLIGYHWSLSQYSVRRLNTHGVDQLYERNDFMADLPFESGELTAIGDDVYRQRFENSFATYEFRPDNSWLVTDRRGITYVFGTSEDARLFDPADPTHTAEWMLEEIRDANDNFIRYTYQKHDNQIYPAYIYYGGHGSEEGIFEVRFGLSGSARPDSQYSYATGFLVETNQLISGIEVYVDGELHRKYELDYTNVNPLVRQTLAGITETGYDENGSATSLPPTTFDYTPSAVSWQETDLYQPPVDIVVYNLTYGLRNNYPLIADGSGDGLIDFRAPQQPEGPKVYIADGKGGWKYESASGYNVVPENIPDVATKFIDFNGDIKRDSITSYINYYVSPPELASSFSNAIEVALQNGTGGQDNGASIADLNGDGLPDIIQSRRRYDASEHTYIEDDTCLNQDGNACVLTDLWQSPVPIIYDDNLAIQLPRSTYIEDCNGDGLADIQGSGGAWLNDGKGGWVRPQSGQKCDFTPLDGIFYRSVDLNGDGLLDRAHALIEVGYSTETPVNKIILNTGQGFTDDVGNMPVLFGRGNGTGQTNNDVSGIRLLDMNGDQLPDVVQSFKKSEQIGADWVDTYEKHVWLNTGSRPYFLKTVHTSTGGTIDLEYKTSAQYMKDDGTQANPSLPIIVDTVSKMTVDDGQGNISTTDYFYEDGHYYFKDSYDKSFAGFRVVTKTDGLGYQTKTYYHQSEYSVPDPNNGESQDHISKKGRPYRTEAYDNNGQLVTSTVNRFEYRTLGADHYYPYLSQTLRQTFDGGVAKATAKAFTYDEIGNVIQVVDYGEVSASGTNGSFSDVGNDLLKTLISYVADSALPYQNQVQGQTGALLSQSRTYYDDLPLGQKDKGNATAQESWLDSSGSWLRSEIEYNEYGLPVETTNPRGFATTIAYDSFNLYPSTVCNAKGHCMESVTDPAVGKPTYAKDPNDSVTETQYDGLGRPTRVEKDGQLISTITYNDDSSPRSVHSTTYNDDGEKVDSYVYLDALGRTIEAKQEAPGSQWITVQTIYDERGNVEKQVQPYFSSSAGFESLDAGKLGTNFTYDALGRVLTAVNPLGTTATDYAGWEVTVTDPNGNSKTLENDARGHLVRVDEQNGATYSTYYSYDPLGNLTQIRDAENNSRTFAYDSLGRRTFQSKLASAAGWNYIYDENGNLIQKTDPKEQVISYSYDELDRVLTENDMSFAYDQGDNAVGRLTKIHKPGYEHSFAYDQWGRVLTDHKQIGDRTFNFTYTYDRMGAVTSLTYPDGAVTEHAYDGAHQLERIRLAGKTFADDFEYTPMGQVARMTLGSGVVIQNNYDENQLYRLTSKVATDGLQDYSYAYDPVGNLLSMVDANTGLTAKTVSYQYDDLYRLTQADYANTANDTDVTQTYDYDPLGNMTYKSDVGQFVYNGQHPHAVTQAGSHVYDYDANGNMTLKDADSMTYDDHDRLIESAGKASFTYGEGYDRLTKTDLVTGGTTYYPDRYFEVHPEKEVKYIYAGALRIAKIEKELAYTPPVTDPDPDPDPQPDPDPDPDPNPQPDPDPMPVPVQPTPTASQQGTGPSGGGGSYASQDELRLMRLISEGQMEKARELSKQIYLYTLNSEEKEKKETLVAGALPESAFENLRISYNRNSAVIVWDSMPKEITAFRIYRSKGRYAGPLEDAEIFIEEIPASRFTNRFVHQFDKAGSRYSYQIEALNAKGWSLLKSPKLHVRQVFIYEGQQKIVDFRNFSNTDFTDVRIKSNEFIDGQETGTPQRLILKPDAALEGGARLSVNFLTCEDKKDGSKICKKLDNQFVEVYVLNRSKAVKKTVAFLQDQVSRLSAAFVPEAHAETGDETTYYLLTDHLGSVDVVLDDEGKVVERRDYLPYGSERVTDAQPDATETDHKFTGKELDDETGLYYYGARYYDSEIGRFVSVDPWEGDLKDPQSLNKYSYTRNNPVIYTDPTGNEFISAVVGTIITLLFTPETAYAPDDEMADAIATGEIKSEEPNIVTTAFAVATGEKTTVGIVKFSFKTVKQLRDYRKLTDQGIEPETAANRAKDYRNNWSDPSKIDDHFARHGKKEFGFESPEEYTQGALDFYNQEGVQRSTDSYGNIRLYDAESNTFGSYNPDGTIRTFMKPKSGQQYFDNRVNKSASEKPITE